MLLLPRAMKRPDITVTITVPDPDVAYDGKLSTHNRIYGIGSGNAVEGTGMRLVRDTDDAQIDAYGYEHRQSTIDAPLAECFQDTLHAVMFCSLKPKVMCQCGNWSSLMNANKSWRKKVMSILYISN
jgi:hypothetical protein